MANSGICLLDLATHINRLHYDEGPEAQRRYVTTFLARLSPATNTLEAVNAGHNPAFLVTGTGEVHRIESSGIPVGLFPWSEYASEQLVLDSGSRLLVYTDGLSETCRGEEMFGEARLLETLQQERWRRCARDHGVDLGALWMNFPMNLTSPTI